MKYADFLKDFKRNVFIIAEIGVNHEGDIDLAKRMILSAKENGADAVKFQTYKADKIASKNSPGYWDFNEEATRSQYELFKKYDTFSKKEYQFLKDYSEEVGVEFMSTPFDLDAVDLIDDLVEVFKISSSDITNLPLIKKIASKNKPIILSTGASNKAEIENALKVIQETNSDLAIALLHCVLEYPTPNKNANLNRIKLLEENYSSKGLIIGYSDHTFPDRSMFNCSVSLALGARIIEKHYTHDKTLKGNDHYHSMDKTDLAVLRLNSNTFLEVMGTSSKIDFNESEESARKNARRGVYTSHSIKKGAVITEKDLICKRPTSSVNPSEIPTIIGKKAKFDLPNDCAISLNDFI